MYSTNPHLGDKNWASNGIKFFAFERAMSNTVPIYEYRIMQK
jgi:hypothetical protein